ncbi:MAG: hypothetical protein RL335_1214 [Bacteroidota bacterium]
MKSFFLFLSILTGYAGYSQPGYEINVTVKPFTSGYLYLAHYYGNKQMLVDSAAINQQHKAVFKGATSLKGGIYMIAWPKKDGYFEIIIDKEQRFSITADSADVLATLNMTGSSDNDRFYSYLKFAQQYGKEMQELQEKWKASITKKDSAATEIELRKKADELTQFRETFIQKNPTHLLSSVFRVFREPAISEKITDPAARNFYYRSLYWDSVDLTDERLIRTPVFQAKLDKYFDEIVPPAADTLKMEVDEVLFRTRANEEMRKYVLLHLTDKYINPKYMGQDAVFVHMFNKYFIPGEADQWLNESTRKFVFDRGYSLMLNVIGEKAADMVMADITGKTRSLYSIQSPYTIVCFWDPTCGHCQTEVPKLDSLYQKKWKAKGVKIFGVKTDGPNDKWTEFIQKYNLNDWTHVYQTPAMKEAEQKSGQPGFRQKYDVYQTPILYLLDKDKKIIAKKLNYEQLDEFLGHRFDADKKN